MLDGAVTGTFTRNHGADSRTDVARRIPARFQGAPQFPDPVPGADGLWLPSRRALRARSFRLCYCRNWSTSLGGARKLLECFLDRLSDQELRS